MSVDQLQGIAVGPITAWFEANVAGVEPPLEFDVIAGGHSNLTFRVTDRAGGAWVLRRPPLHQVLATAHDMQREHTIISALADSDVPVPATHGLCVDEAVNGRPFYVMDFVDGTVVRSGDEARELDPAVRLAASRSIVDVLARIHAVDIDAVGLGDLGRREDYVARQLRRWMRQFDESKTREIPQVREIHDHLAARTPEQQGATIVHGDYRLDNCILHADGSVAAVLDWEICTLGDPLADLGQLLVYWAEPDDQTMPLQNPPTAVEGFASRAEVLDLYQQVSDRDLSGIDFYLGFASWRLACILEGVYSRYVAGAMGDKVPSGGVDAFVDRIDALVGDAKAAVERLP